MKSHNCPFSSSCSYYDADNCQVCPHATKKKTLTIDDVIENLNRDGYTVEIERKSYDPSAKVTVTSGSGATCTRYISYDVWGTSVSVNMLHSMRREIEARQKFNAACADYTAVLTPEAVMSKTTIEKVIEDVKKNMNKKPGWSIKNVVFNDPATIVFWEDGSKTVVKAHNEVYDPEKGLAMAICKKVFGNQGNYFNVFSKWLPEDYETPSKTAVGKNDSRPWRIWYRHYNEDGKTIGSGVYIKSYQRKADATRVARKKFGDETKYQFVVSMANPFGEVVRSWYDL